MKRRYAETAFSIFIVYAMAFLPIKAFSLIDAYSDRLKESERSNASRIDYEGSFQRSECSMKEDRCSCEKSGVRNFAIIRVVPDSQDGKASGNFAQDYIRPDKKAQPLESWTFGRER